MRARIIEAARETLNQGVFLPLNLQEVLEAQIPLEEYQKYFPDFKSLIVAIFDQFRQETDMHSTTLDQPGPKIKTLYEYCLSIYNLQKKYRFIFLDFKALLSGIEEIKDRYFELLQLRKAQLSHLFQGLVQAGLFKKEPIPGQFENLINQVILISEFWSTQSTIIFEKINVAYYAKLTFSIVVPYLTERGIEEYQQTLLAIK